MQSRADLPKLEARNRATATAEEAKAVVAGSIAYFGKYSVDEAGKVVSIDIQGSTFANQIGSTVDNYVSYRKRIEAHQSRFGFWLKA